MRAIDAKWNVQVYSVAKKVVVCWNSPWPLLQHHVENRAELNISGKSCNTTATRVISHTGVSLFPPTLSRLDTYCTEASSLFRTIAPRGYVVVGPYKTLQEAVKKLE